MTYGTQPDYSRQVIFQQVVRPASNGLAVTALVLGIVAAVFGVGVLIPIAGLFFAFVAFFPAILGVVFGHVGLVRAKAVNVGRGNALSGLLLGYITLGLIVLTTIFWFAVIGAGAAAGSAPA